jgi:nucleoside-diphosphate-sugar epimerase
VRALVLGGTRFLGRALVDALLEQGHEPTLFNRGLTQPELFPDVEKLRGDRSADLSALEGREWDAVLDVAAYMPGEVRLAVETLHDNVSRYVFVSSISVYADQSVPPVEGAAVEELAPGQETDEDPELYGARKAACERIVEEAIGDAALVVRPGLIVGPHDPTGRFTYWPHRVARGGEVLGPGSPDDLVQFIDVRDLASWIVQATANGAGGTFNATGEPMRFGDLLEQCRGVSGSDATVTWVASGQLLAEEVGPWMELPLWLPLAEYAGIQRASVERARATGLTYRPLAETIRATLADAEPVDGVGLTPERERELLELAG